jgi:hypothetical protein
MLCGECLEKYRQLKVEALEYMGGGIATCRFRTLFFYIEKYEITFLRCGTQLVGQLVEALRYKPESCGFDSRWHYLKFSLT